MSQVLIRNIKVTFNNFNFMSFISQVWLCNSLSIFLFFRLLLSFKRGPNRLFSMGESSLRESSRLTLLKLVLENSENSIFLKSMLLVKILLLWFLVVPEINTLWK